MQKNIDDLGILIDAICRCFASRHAAKVRHSLSASSNELETPRVNNLNLNHDSYSSGVTQKRNAMSGSDKYTGTPLVVHTPDWRTLSNWINSERVRLPLTGQI